MLSLINLHLNIPLAFLCGKEKTFDFVLMGVLWFICWFTPYHFDNVQWFHQLVWLHDFRYTFSSDSHATCDKDTVWITGFLQCYWIKSQWWLQVETSFLLNFSDWSNLKENCLPSMYNPDSCFCKHVHRVWCISFNVAYIVSRNISSRVWK